MSGENDSSGPPVEAQATASSAATNNGKAAEGQEVGF
jgi:hypothetical protein